MIQRGLFITICFIGFILVSAAAAAEVQRKDHAIYIDKVLNAREKQEESDRDKARAEAKGEEYKPEEKKSEKKLLMDFSTIQRPRSIEEFKYAWHFPPIRQWWSSTCWSFSTTSFLESEIKRQTGQEIKLSELYTVYWEYVEKVREYVRTKGESLVDEGSEGRAVLNRWKQYGIVRESDYTGLIGDAKVIDHDALIKELQSYLNYMKENKLWDEATAIGHTRLILDRYMGRPPEIIVVDGRQMSPKDFLKDVLKINIDDYVEFMSTLSAPFWTEAEYKVPDNWWHGKEYINVPLDDWYGCLHDAVIAGFTVAIGGDVSEPGYEGTQDIGIIPTFDCPPGYIDQDSREYRFWTKITEDDHGIQIVGFKKLGNHDWYLVKDSSRSGQEGIPGYFFYRDDYVRMKMLTFMVHRDAAKALLAKVAANAPKEPIQK